MRLSAAFDDCLNFHVYDYLIGSFRNDLCWVDDTLNQVGVGNAYRGDDGGKEFVHRIEQRRSVLIITALKWIALDLPEEEEKKNKWATSDEGCWKMVPVEVAYGADVPGLVVVR